MFEVFPSSKCTIFIMLINAIDNRFDEALRHFELLHEFLDCIECTLFLLKIQTNLDFT